MPVFQLPDEPRFPHPDLAEPEGLLAVGGDLSVERLVAAYAQGIFPWYSRREPVLWWSPDPRMVLFPREFTLARSMRRVLNSGRFTVRCDTAFRAVVEGCAGTPRRHEKGTWIVREMVEAYCALHATGLAHSVEVWEGATLAGGLYGVALGRVFCGESMFSRADNASKSAFAALAAVLAAWDFLCLECQFHTDHLASLGAREIPRAVYLRLLEDSARSETRRGPWTGEFAETLAGTAYARWAAYTTPRAERKAP